LGELKLVRRCPGHTLILMTGDADVPQVKPLTAEVRVLVIGKRQVTGGMYKQLDLVAPDLIEPFGRVRSSVYEMPGAHFEVVGRHRETGYLVRSDAPVDPSWRHQVPPRSPDLSKVPPEWHDLPLIILGR
jgi:hypothetical protein